ncbi:MAG: TetR/AcrR family transcriptional regulator [Nitrospirae bacterium]|nr:TetR/AcrR family transcriptional regulator [Nitrospirota bacterium]
MFRGLFAKEPDVNAKERILKAAYDLFLRDGIETTPTRKIAQAAKVNEVTLFRHFRSKDGLIRAVIERHAPSVVAAKLGDLAPTDDLEEDLYRLTRRIMGFHTEHAEFFRFVFVNLSRTKHQDIFRNIPTQFLAHQKKFFGSLCRRRGLDCTAVCMEYVAPIVLRSLRQVFLGDPYPFPGDEKFARTHARIFAGALGGESRSRK